MGHLELLMWMKVHHVHNIIDVQYLTMNIFYKFTNNLLVI